MKKYILKSLFVSMLCMLAASCQDTNEFDQLDSSKAQVSFSIAMDSPLSRSRGADDNTWGGEYDNYVGDDYDNRIALDELVVKIEADGGKKYTLSNIIKWQAGAGNEYSFVGVIENLKSPVSLENAKISVYANMGRNAEETTFAQNADCIPMWGMQFMESLTLTPAKRVTLPSISLLRAMAKIEVALNDEMKEDYTLTGATLDKVNPNGYPMPKSGVVNGTKTTTELGFEEGFNPLEGTKQSLPLIKDEKTGSWYVYLPEMKKENDPKITVQLNDGAETGTFSVKRYIKDQEPQAMDIVRNHWYKYIISGFDASEITVEYKTVEWKDKFIEIGGEGFLYLNKDVIEIYNANIDEDQLKFSSSSRIVSVALTDLYTHENDGTFSEDEGDGLSAYYITKFGQKIQLGDDPGFEFEGKEDALAAEQTILNDALKNLAYDEDVLNGGITIYSPYINDATYGNSHYDTHRYLEYLVTNEQGLTATFRVVQYPPVIVTNEEGYFSYRSDQKLTDDWDEASHFHNYKGYQSIHLTGLYFYHEHEWSKEFEQTNAWWNQNRNERDYSWVVPQACPANQENAGCETVHYGNIGNPVTWKNSKGQLQEKVYGGIYRPTVYPTDYFVRWRYNGIGASNNDSQGLSIGALYQKEDGRWYRKHYVWNVNPIFYNLYVGQVYKNNSSNRLKGQSDIYSMTHATTTYYGDEGTGWSSWGKQNYTNHRMYNIQIANSELNNIISDDVNYTIGYPILTKDGVTENTSYNGNMISPNFAVASQLGETHYQSIISAAASYKYKVPVVGEFYQLAVEHCREYVETSYQDLDNSGSWDAGEPVTHYDNWRLPTRAEVELIAELQKKSRTMDQLLVNEYYFCVTGADDDANTDINNYNYWVSSSKVAEPQATGYYIRCVRDIKPNNNNR